MTRTSLLLLLAFAAPAAASAAELSPGTFELAGGTRLQLQTADDEVSGSKATFTTFGVSALGTYYVSPTVGLGADIELSRTTFKLDGGPESTTTRRFFGPSLVLTAPLSPEASFFGRGTIGLAGLETETTSRDGWGIAVGGGLRYFFNRSVAADLGVFYAVTKVSGGGVSETVSALTVGVEIAIFLNNHAPAQR